MHSDITHIPSWVKNQSLYEWAHRELSPYLHSSSNASGYENFLKHVNETQDDVFILDCEGREIRIRVKPNLGANPLDDYVFAPRLRGYVALFTKALTLFEDSNHLSLAISLKDQTSFCANYPWFGFQKTIGTSKVLIPDVDFIQYGYYDDDFRDQPFASKFDQVVFCGSSTGAAFSEEDVLNDNFDRLSLARRYLGHTDIVIKIGAAVQCLSEEAAAMLRSKPYFGSISYPEQLLRRYILSVDGNGATCSRVLMTLRSQSLLLKYRSNEILFYFHGLHPMIHYVPIDNEDDLELKLAAIRSGEINASQIVENANLFYKKNLRKNSIEEYVYYLLKIFSTRYATNLS